MKNTRNHLKGVKNQTKLLSQGKQYYSFSQGLFREKKRMYDFNLKIKSSLR